MVASIKYFITDSGGSWIDWSLNISPLTVLGKEAQVVGGSGSDSVFVQAGSSLTATALFSGSNAIYLTGRFSDYAQAAPDGAVYTLTRTGGLSTGQAEIIKVLGGGTDKLYFADGFVDLGDVRLKVSNAFVSMSTTVLSASDTAINHPVPVDMSSPVANPSPVKAFVVDSAGADVAPLPQTGQTAVVVGGSGSDTVYVRKGTSVTATALFSGDNKVFLTGNFSDYAQAAPDGAVYTLTRTGGLATGQAEVIKVLGGGTDKLYFADGFVNLSDAGLKVSNAFVAMSTAVFNSSVTDTTPGLSDISAIAVTSTPVAVQNDFYKPGDVITFTVSMKQAVTVAGTPQLNLVIGSDTSKKASFVSGLSTSTALIFTYVVASGDLDSNGISWNASALSLNGGTIKIGEKDARLLNPAQTDLSAQKVDGVVPSQPTLVLGAGVSNGATSAEAIASSGVITASGESGAKVVATFSNGSHSVAKTVILTALNSPQPVVLGSGDIGSSGTNVLRDGTINVSVTQTDAAGNAQTASAATTSFILDTSAPATPTLTLGDGVLGGATHAEAIQSSGVIVANVENASTLTATFTRGTASVVHTYKGTGSSTALTLVSHDLTILGNGTINVAVTQTDAAGNPQATAGMISFVLDTVPPISPTLMLGMGVTNGTAGIVEALSSNGVVQVTGELGATIQILFISDDVHYVTKTLLGTGMAQAVTLTNADLNLLPDGVVMVYGIQTDAAGNAQNVLHAQTSFTLDTVLPSISNVFISGANAAGNAPQVMLSTGSKVLVNVTTNETVTVNTDASYVLNFGGNKLRSANYVSGNGTNTLLFTYTVVAGDNTVGLGGITASNNALFGVITDSVGNNVSNPLTTAVSSGTNGLSIATTGSDQTPPTITSIFLSGGANNNNILVAGSFVTATVVMSEAVTVTGVPQLSLNIGGATVMANYLSGSGSNTLNFVYTILNGQMDSNGISINANALSIGSATIVDLANNNAILTTHAVVDNPNYVVDTSTISFRFAASDAYYALGTHTFTLTGNNFTALLGAGENSMTDIKSRLNWSKFTYSVDNTGSPIAFGASDIASAFVIDSNHLQITLASSKYQTLESIMDFGGNNTDSVTIQSGFTGENRQDGRNHIAITVYSDTINLGSDTNNPIHGQLIAPTIVAGGLYYFWDYSGSGVANSGDALNHDVLDGIFNNALTGQTNSTIANTDGMYGTTNVYRYTVLNGNTFAVPTYGGMVSGNVATQFGGQVYTHITSYVVNNPIYQDLLAIWDGKVTAIGGNGTPSGWNSLIWSATPSSLGHVYVDLSTGTVVNASDSSASVYSVLQKITNPTYVTVSNNHNYHVANEKVNNILYTYTFSETITGLTENSFDVYNGSISSVSGSGKVWFVDVVPDTGVNGGVLGLVLRSNTVRDSQGNYNAASYVNNKQWVDDVAPDAVGLALGVGVSDGASLLEAQASAGVVTVSAESGARVAVTFLNPNNIKTLTKSLLVPAPMSGIVTVAAESGATVNVTLKNTEANTRTLTFTAISSLPTSVTLSSTDVMALGGVLTTVTATQTDAMGSSSSASVLRFSLLNPSQQIMLSASEVANLGGTGINVLASQTDSFGQVTSATVSDFTVSATGGVLTVLGNSGNTLNVRFTNIDDNRLTKILTGIGSSGQAVVLNSADLGLLHDGTISVTAIQTDWAGNVQRGSLVSTSFLLDTVLPPTPTLELNVTVGANASQATASSGIVSVSAEDNRVLSVIFVRDATRSITRIVTGTGSPQAIALSSADLTTLGDGVISVTVATSDAVGNVARATPVSFVLDTTPPVGPSVLLGNGVANGATLIEATQSTGIITVVGEPNARIQAIFSDGTHTLTRTVTGTGMTQALVLSSADVGGMTGLQNGTIVASVTQTDFFGNAQRESPIGLTFVLDTELPDLRLVLRDGVSDGGATSSEVTASSGVVTIETGSDVTVSVRFVSGTTSIEKIVTGTGMLQRITLSANDVGGVSGLQDGTVTVTAIATDVAHNTRQQTATFVLDTTPPSLSLSLSAGISNGATSMEATTNAGVISLTAENSSAVNITFSDGLNSVTRQLTGTNTQQTVTLSASEIGNAQGGTTLHDGAISVIATAVDRAGNSTVYSTSFVLDTIPPITPTIAHMTRRFNAVLYNPDT